MNTHIFTYGSLMFEPVWTQVVGTPYRSCSAYISGYERVCVENAAYPAVIRSENRDRVVEGVLYLNVTEEDALLLDRFEGEEYTRIAVPVCCPERTHKMVEGWVYLYSEAYADALVYTDWDPCEFEAAMSDNLNSLMKRLQ